MGFALVSGNLSYGGRSPNPRTKHISINGLVASKTYIGTMAGIVATMEASADVTRPSIC